MKKVLALSVALIMVLCLFACSAKNLLVGSWEHEETVLGVVTRSTYVFNEDGTGKTTTVLGIELDMTYVVDGDKLSITTETLGVESTKEYTFELTVNELTIIDGEERTVYTKK